MNWLGTDEELQDPAYRQGLQQAAAVLVLAFACFAGGILFCNWLS